MADSAEEVDFHHPYTPYSIQETFMNTVYQTLEHSKVGILESPTGTARGFSIFLLFLWHNLYVNCSNLAYNGTNLSCYRVNLSVLYVDLSHGCAITSAGNLKMASTGIKQVSNVCKVAASNVDHSKIQRSHNGLSIR